MNTLRSTVAAIALSATAMLGSTLPAAASAPVLEAGTQAFVDAVTASGGKPIYSLSYEDARNVLAGAQAQKLASAATRIQDTSFPAGPTGKVNVRIVRPAGAKGDLPVVMYFHGGGWVMGDRNTHDHLIRELSAAANAAVVFVDYDRAPEFKFPAINEQAYAAVEYVAQHGRSLGLDGSRLAVAGDSAGGNMAASITLLAKERKGPKISHQLLFYPVTDDVSANASYQAFGEGPWLTEKAMHYFLDATFPADTRNSPIAFPLKADVEQLRGLPPATILVAENDLLREEGEAYGRKLTQAGVSVMSTRYNGTIHDFVMLNGLANTPAAKAAIAQGAAALKAAFATK
ncbi:alpha/beta hydrolase fold domain-containing protein [Niveispirillum sp. SYP-B3756]|uniref:alpha/beta hydrolase n=1 Tax=Niveispirillum sp. SYP-B3756 TaxID=2662178 RepID=UPI001291D05E|nr:alpha/beta hydrolase [Niveispirillum sp. SYP-B3756]MQP64410.1 alpha/beta hydrolase fold domain-containing protein [Niveispirillum sp. SYP-B3756]